MFSWPVMGHYTLRALICLCSHYVCASVTLGQTHKGPSEIVTPHRVNSKGEFLTHDIPTHWLRTATEDDLVHYHLPISGQIHHLELRPNRGMIAPGALEETHAKGGMSVRRVGDVQCHFTGHVRGVEGSRVAVSTCQGLVGYIHTPREHYMIKPLSLPSARHPHLVYQRLDASVDPAERRRTPASVCTTRGSHDKLLHKRSIEHHDNVKNMYTTKVKNDLYLELLLVLDKSFLNHHRSLDVVQYLMTVMNMAHNLFVQDSLGRPLYLSIVRIIRLEDDDNEINLSLKKDPVKILKNFQSWQFKMNPGNDSHPNHHDLAVLFTRADIYGDDGAKDLLGLAHQAGLCDPHKQAIVCEDIGLALGFVVSHEIGHSLGFLHDSVEDNGCSTVLANGLNTVMNPKISVSTGDWSPCSKKYMKIFTESGFGHCLQDEPADHPFTFLDELPGTIYDGDWQCRFKFGSNASLCNTAPRCDTILCQVPDEGCIDSSSPPADGTSCGENKWCYHGECLQRGMRPMSRDGGWGPWGPWSKCTRSCGTGVAFSERRCDSPQPANGGEFCKGAKKKYMICQAEPCGDFPRFRDQQCSAFNQVPFPEDGKYHKWKAYPTVLDDPCVLTCINENGTIANLADRVKDGTSCMKGIRDVCIAGKCVTIPCDLNMDSGAVEDVCGVCHGDGTTCTLKEGSKYFEPPPNNKDPDRPKDEIIKLIDIPDGSQNIHVEESEPSRSKIEVRDSDGNVVYVEGVPGLFEVPGSRAWLGMIRAEQETLHIPGPVLEPLTIWVSPMENITFTYSLAVKTEKRQGAFQWDYLDWTSCSSHCGIGTSISVPKCIEQSSGAVDDRYCDEPKPPEKVKTCESEPCAPRWLIGDWSKCSHTRQKVNPSQTRIIRCARPISGEISDLIFISLSCCPQPKPKEERECSIAYNCEDKHNTRTRRKRKIFHRPNQLHSKNSKKIYLPTTRLANLSRRRRKRRRERHVNKEDNGEEKYEDKALRQFTVERGRTDLDKLSCKDLKLTIKGSDPSASDEEAHQVTTRTLYGKCVREEMEKIEQNRTKYDPI